MASPTEMLERAESRLAREQTRRVRGRDLVQLTLGYAAGRVAVQVAEMLLPTSITEGMGDEAGALALAGYGGYRYLKGGKYASAYAGGALAAATPAIDSVVDRIMAAVQSLTTDEGA